MMRYAWICDYCQKTTLTDSNQPPHDWYRISTADDPLMQRTHLCCEGHRAGYLRAYKERRRDRATATEVWDENHSLRRYILQDQMDQCCTAP